MNQEYLLIIIVSVFIFLILLTILKSLIKAIITSIIIILLFRIGWVYSSDDLKEKLHLDTFISPKYQEDFYNKYDDYKDRREKDEIINTREINNKIDEQIDEKVKKYLENNSQ